MYVFDAETLAFLAVNEAAVVQYGYSREEFLGMTIKDLRRPEDIPAHIRAATAAQNLRDLTGRALSRPRTPCRDEDGGRERCGQRSRRDPRVGTPAELVRSAVVKCGGQDAPVNRTGIAVAARCRILRGSGRPISGSKLIKGVARRVLTTEGSLVIRRRSGTHAAPGERESRPC